MAFQDQDVYLGSSEGLFRTSDLGTTWTDALSVQPVISVLASPGAITIAEWEGGVRRAADPAAGWDRIDADPGLRNPSALARFNGALYVGTRGPDHEQVTAGVLRQRAPLWDEVNEGLTDLLITDLVATRGALFAGTDHDGVFRTVDGATWESVSQGLVPLSRSVQAINGSLYAAGFRSDDGGDTWLKGLIRPPFVAVASHLSHGTVHYVARQYLGGVWASVDDGRTWQRSAEAGSADRLLQLAVSGDSHALLTDQGLLISEDGGRSLRWAREPSGASGASFLGYSMGALHAGFSRGQVRRSTDGGDTWEELPEAPPPEATSYDRHVWAVVAAGDRLLAATSSGLRAYSPGAAAWEPAATQLPDVRQLLAGRDGRVYASASDEVYSSVDAGRTWRLVGRPLGVAVVQSLAQLDGRLYAGTSEGLYHIALDRQLPEAMPRIAIIAPSPAAVLDDGAASVDLSLDLREYEGPWQWQVDTPFPYEGVADGTQVYGPRAVATGLRSGRMHTIHVTPTTPSGVVAFPGLARSVTVYVRPPDWDGSRDLGDTRIAARLGSDIVVVGATGANMRRIDISQGAGRPDGSVSWSPDGRELLVSAPPHLPRYARLSLFRVSVASGESIALTAKDVTDQWPAWSPDGDRVAYIAYGPAPAGRSWRGLYAMDLSTGRLRLVADGVLARTPSWSPDGSRLAYIKDNNVWIAFADGSGAQRLFDGPELASWVAWSPDGARMAIVRDGQVHVVNADGSQMARLTDFPGRVGLCSWAPDASRIAVEGMGPNGVGLYVMKADGTDLTLILPDAKYPSWSPFLTAGPRPTLTFTTPEPGRTMLAPATDDAARVRVTMSGHDEGWNWRVDEPFPVAGPAGGRHVEGREATITGLAAGATHVIYATLVDAAGNVLTPPVLAVAAVRVAAVDAGPLDDTRIAFRAGQAIYTVHPAGLDPQRVTNASETGGVWSPDGGSLAFVEDVGDESHLVVTNPIGGDRRLLYTAPGLRDPAWFPDGSGILVATDSGVLAVKVATGEATRMTQAARGYQAPAWSPNGADFASLRYGTVRVTDAAYQERVVGATLGPVRSFAWAPDGRDLCLGARDGVCVVSADGAAVTHVGEGAGPKWSPDGTRIAYRDAEGGITLYAVASGVVDNVVPANHGHVIGDLAWSPDGSSVAFVDMYYEDLSYLYVIDIDTRHRTILSERSRGATAVAWSAPSTRASALTVRAPSEGVILPAGTTSTQLLVDSDGDWAWVLDRLFPTRGVVTRNLGMPDGATVDPLRSGRTHTLRVAAIDSDDRLTRPLDIVTVRFSVATREDANADGTVDIRDLVFVASRFGVAGPFDTGNPDVDDDGTVTMRDLVLAAASFGERLEGMPTAAPALPGRRHGAELVRWTRDAEQLEATTREMRKGVATLRALLASVAPSTTTLLPNFPNPFNPETWIPFDLAEPGEVILRVYDTRGLLVRRIRLGPLPVGEYRDRLNAAYWDGRSDIGEPAASGVYIVELRVGSHRETRRLTVRK
jgi:Tol biopolymer transport system component